MKGKLLLQSLSPLFLLVCIQNISSITYENNEFIGYKQVACDNVISIFFGSLFVLSILFFISLGRFKSRGLENPETVKTSENINDMNLSFFITYILPLTAMELSDLKDIIVFVLIMVFTVFLLCKTDLYYANPVLTFTGYNIYEINTKSKSRIKIITKDKVNPNDKLYLRPITQDRVYYARKVSDNL